MANDDKKIEQIEKQAYEWLSIMHSDCKTPGEVKQFQSWLESDARHKMVYDEVYSLWSKLSDLQEVIEPESYQDLGTQHFWKEFISLKPKWLILAGSIGCLVLLSVTLLTFVTLPSMPTGDRQDYFTQTSEIKEVILPDTSMVTLGALSSIEVEYSETVRRVGLISGEAFFSVKRNAARPFIVTVADAEIRVLGTKFDVRRSLAGVRVSVLEGKVTVTQTREEDLDGDGVKTRVKMQQVLLAHEKILAEPDGKLSEIQPIRYSPGAWREGRLIYDNAKLSEVLSDADRYYRGNIIIDTEDLKQLPVSAAFRTDQIQEMMDTLSMALPLTTRKLSNGDIIIQRRDKPQG